MTITAHGSALTETSMTLGYLRHFNYDLDTTKNEMYGINQYVFSGLIVKTPTQALNPP